MSDSTPKSRTRKTARKHFVPPKPKKYPLTPHLGGKWMKKINGKLHYFGNWPRRVNGKLVRVEADAAGHESQRSKAVADSRSRLVFCS